MNTRGLFGIIKLLLIIILLLVGFFAYFYFSEDDLAECNNDSDCIKVQTTCCPCSMGGEEECVSEEEALEISKELEDCDDSFCAAVYNCKEFDCICLDGECVKE